MIRTEDILLKEIESLCSMTEILSAAKYLNMNYTLFLSDVQLWHQVRQVFKEKCQYIFSKYEDLIIANKFINVLLMKYYPCERIVKYALVNKSRSREDTILFEMPVLDSRIDICRINGNSYAYEIKSELDSFKRLEKQIHTYFRVFEYIYIVCPKAFYDDVIKRVPSFCGLRLYTHNPDNGKISFHSKRKAIISPCIDSWSQLQCLSQEQLFAILKSRKIKKIPSSKEDRVQLIYDIYKPKTINTINLFFL